MYNMLDGSRGKGFNEKIKGTIDEVWMSDEFFFFISFLSFLFLQLLCDMCCKSYTYSSHVGDMRTTFINIMHIAPCLLKEWLSL